MQTVVLWWLSLPNRSVKKFRNLSQFLCNTQWLTTENVFYAQRVIWMHKDKIFYGISVLLEGFLKLIQLVILSSFYVSCSIITITIMCFFLQVFKVFSAPTPIARPNCNPKVCSKAPLKKCLSFMLYCFSWAPQRKQLTLFRGPRPDHQYY